MSKQRIVAKFGGTSMGDAKAIMQSASVAREQGAVITVVSATSGTTDELIALADMAKSESYSLCDDKITEILERHLAIAQEIEADQQARDHIEHTVEELRTLVKGMALLKEVSDKTMDSLMSIGERLSSVLMVQAMNQFDGLPAVYIDAREIVITDDVHMNARPQTDTVKEKADELITPYLKKQVFVTQGFIGKTKDGETTTLGRGGSDYSAAIFAEAIRSEELQIWTDVAGVATTDPRITSEARPIATISFQEAAELATSGAKVLYPPTMIPARRANIPVFVGSTFEPEAGGTTIDIAAHDKPLVRAITVKKDQALLTLSTARMSQQHGFLAKIFNIFAEYRVSVDQITTSEISVAVTIDSSVAENKEFLSALEQFAYVDLEENLNVVTLIGNEVNHTPGFMKRVFTSVQQDEPHMSVRAVFQGASKHSVGILVSANHGKMAVERLHKTFIEQGETA